MPRKTTTQKSAATASTTEATKSPLHLPSGTSFEVHRDVPSFYSDYNKENNDPMPLGNLDPRFQDLQQAIRNFADSIYSLVVFLIKFFNERTA
ncbi:hypothetical protein N7523_005815 [Penicillium sp. IBT 18751x]|nr:hypothetical protein N7523_005815 [Penicillium sp. IBT 18751x]